MFYLSSTPLKLGCSCGSKDFIVSAYGLNQRITKHNLFQALGNIDNAKKMLKGFQVAIDMISLPDIFSNLKAFNSRIQEFRNVNRWTFMLRHCEIWKKGCEAWRKK